MRRFLDTIDKQKRKLDKQRDTHKSNGILSHNTGNQDEPSVEKSLRSKMNQAASSSNEQHAASSSSRPTTTKDNLADGSREEPTATGGGSSAQHRERPSGARIDDVRRDPQVAMTMMTTMVVAAQRTNTFVTGTTKMMKRRMNQITIMTFVMRMTHLMMKLDQGVDKGILRHMSFTLRIVRRHLPGTAQQNNRILAET